VLSACSHTQPKLSKSIPTNDWKHTFIHYQSTLPPNHAESAQNTLGISEQIKSDMRARFGHLSKQEAAYALANWVVAKDGFNLEYDVDSNLKPDVAYQQRRGNCLSYSLLLTQLADALGIKFAVNSVDIPDTWSMEDDTLFFYRHVNVVYKAPARDQIFDLTPGAYDSRYPQKAMNEQQALALFHNNRALDFYRTGNYSKATHLIKLAVSLSPDNPDIWTNVGAILKRTNSLAQAQDALQFALSLDAGHVVAASQLERLYRKQGDLKNAAKYSALATRARANNPYYLFRRAKKQLLKQDYNQAQELIKRAIKKHRHDPRFFALRGVIENKLNNFKAAQKSFKKASKLELNLEQKQQYANKAMLLAKLAKSSRKSGNSNYPMVEVKPL